MKRQQSGPVYGDEITNSRLMSQCMTFRGACCILLSLQLKAKGKKEEGKCPWGKKKEAVNVTSPQLHYLKAIGVIERNKLGG